MLRRIMRVGLLCLVMLCCGMAAKAPSIPHSPQPPLVFLKNAKASFYGAGFHGKQTASGTRFDMHRFTAAHKSLPFGTTLKVVNRRTKAWVYVTVTDRGPFVKGRDLDLSHAAAKHLGMISAGVCAVSIYRRVQ